MSILAPAPFVHVNIWDDYRDDLPDKPPSTYAYVEQDDVSLGVQREVLEGLQTRLQAWAFAHDQDLHTRLEMFDSKKAWPSLDDSHTTHYQRWELFIDGLTHAGREHFVDHLGHVPLEYEGQGVKVFSES